MKVRNGFVSNSSSTSFVILLPENFDLEKDIDWKSIQKSLFEYSDDVAKEDRIPKAKALVAKFIKEGYLSDDSNDYYGDDEMDRPDISTLTNALKKYIVHEIETGADNPSSVSLLNNKKVKKILEAKV